MTGIREFDGAIAAADEWIDDLTKRLVWRDREKVYSALIATLHALRDSLPAHEAVFLGDYLTILLRGRYYEGWRLAKYSSFKSRDAFLERIREGVHHDPGIDAEQVARRCVGAAGGASTRVGARRRESRDAEGIALSVADVMRGGSLLRRSSVGAKGGQARAKRSTDDGGDYHDANPARIA